MFFPVVTIFLTKVSSFLENISSVCQSIPLFYEDLMFFPKVSLTLKLSSLFPEGFKYFPTITSLLRRTRVDWFSRDDCIYIEKSIIKVSLLSLKYFTNIVSSFASEGFKYFLKVSSVFEDFMNFSNVTISLLRSVGECHTREAPKCAVTNASLYSPAINELHSQEIKN